MNSNIKYVGFVVVLFITQISFSQNDKTASDFNINTTDLVHDINNDLNERKPHGEYNCYVISGVFKQLNNAKAYMKSYRSESGNTIFIFKELEKYYVAVEGPVNINEAKELAKKLNSTENTQNLSNGSVWIYVKK